jgi:hypothetical protein
MNKPSLVFSGGLNEFSHLSLADIGKAIRIMDSCVCCPHFEIADKSTGQEAALIFPKNVSGRSARMFLFFVHTL